MNDVGEPRIRLERCLYDPRVIRRPIPPTRRTTPSKRTRLAATAGVSLLLVATVGCSRNKGSDADTSTSATPTTTAPKPLDAKAGTYELAYLSTDAKETTVFLTDGKGSETDVITRLPGRAEALQWSPDGKRLLLDGDGSGDFELQVVDAESGAATVLAPSPTSNEGGASWSPDGSAVVFFSNRDGAFAGYVVPSAGGEPVRITPPEAPSVTDLSWSPDGKQVAFSTSSSTESDVWVVDADGANPKKVSTEPGSTQAIWSPDGELLAISAQPLGNDSAGIYTLDPTTGDTEEVVDTEFRDAFPIWAPDGEMIYFISAVPNDDADGGAADDILRVSAEGGKPEAIIDDPISVESEQSLTSDGRLLVFSVQRLGDKEVFVANADGTGAIPISRSERSDSFGAWRPGTGPDAG